MKTKLEIYTDGGARNNPGPAGIGVVIGDKEYGEYIGETTNNVAEYKAIIFALKKTRHLLGKSKLKDTEVIVNSDSELAVNQLNGKFKILEKDLQPLFLEIWNLKFDFPNLQFKHIRREKNQRADYLVNQAINKQQNTLNI
ncbi:MAG: ribonuclease HI family protein [Candidatus Pacebacteria bacterium]|jgi:ribonuclease HI|nr:ribonuclease HI family protein [Candidatus Paceibacterota bacterium]